MKFLLLLFVLVNLYNVSESRLSENLKVQIDDGLIVGRYMTTVSGRGIRSFLSIPYAAPPVGDLRFKGPKKPVPWKDNVLIAQNEPPMCTQTNVFDRGEKQDLGQEDCLYLNVYTPNINVSENAFKKLPVMVWFHGGGWMEFHSGHSVYGPGYLLDHDIILVTGNYRLGILGFLSTEDENCPGNFGFKDQHMILEWVHENIEKFGGDKDSVTIFGESAGGAIVNLLMNSPKSRKLFHRAISQSGSMMNVWSEPHPAGLAKERVTKLAEMMECSADSTKDMIECLRKVPANKITAAIRNFMVWDYDPVIPFGAVVERSGLKEDRFIVDSVIDKESFDIPWMTGVTSEEMLFKAAGILNSKKLSNDIQEKWEIIFPATFNYDHLSEQNIKEINAAIYDYYHKDEGLLGENLVTMWSDGWFVNGFIDYLQQRLSSNRHANTFVYLFSHKGSISFSEVFGSGPDKFVGTSHLDDLLYLFPMRNTFPQFFNSIPTEEDENLRKILTKLWVDFATTGTPAQDLSELPAWTPATKFPLDYMRIGNKNGNSDKLLEMEKDLFSKNAQFWINLREKYGLRLWKNADEKKIKSEL